jgi:hypothetical protein
MIKDAAFAKTQRPEPEKAAIEICAVFPNKPDQYEDLNDVANHLPAHSRRHSRRATRFTISIRFFAAQSSRRLWQKFSRDTVQSTLE